ncbi:bacteriophage abortive infection AbiH family protein [Bacteroides ovatus]|nr:bacteriophage abortive infection AbiH family protein [Bacteroides ovatus]MCS2475528.1 bacteriophage abortive infection AbiH family protein [Bacteroides ovatus]
MENGILYIIGNGLDKYHKINTGYDDWYNYVKKEKIALPIFFLI